MEAAPALVEEDSEVQVAQAPEERWLSAEAVRAAQVVDDSRRAGYLVAEVAGAEAGAADVSDAKR